MKKERSGRLVILNASPA